MPIKSRSSCVIAWLTLSIVSVYYIASTSGVSFSKIINSSYLFSYLSNSLTYYFNCYPFWFIVFSIDRILFIVIVSSLNLPFKGDLPYAWRVLFWFKADSALGLFLIFKFNTGRLFYVSLYWLKPLSWGLYIKLFNFLVFTIVFYYLGKVALIIFFAVMV